MKGRAEVLSQVRRQVTDICHRALNTPAFKARIVTALRRAVPVDAVFLASADPDTLLLTGGISDAVIRSAAPLFMRNELLEDDVNKFFQLAQARPPVWSLFAATGGRMAASARYREILEPLHLGDELRVALVSGRLCWGYLCLHREAGSAPFTSEDAAFLASLGPLLAEGLRASLMAPRLAVPEPEGGPGLIVLGPELDLAAANEAARAWLEQTSQDEWHGGQELPIVVQAVAARLRALRRTGEDRDSVIKSRLRTRSGGWLDVRATWLSGPGMANAVAVVLEPARTPEVLPLIARAHELTDRELTVVRLVTRGLSTSQLASQLHISENTVQDHFKSIFDKVGVRSRRELVAALVGRLYGDSEAPIA